MKKELDRLTNERFDIVIIGGGIHGAVLALEAVRSGYRVALLEKGDFGHSTSANSLKIIHGGIRYLQHGDFKRMRESILSRRSMMAFAPHIVKPLACLMPTYGHGVKGREMMRLAFGIYDVIAFDRNQGLDDASTLPGGTAISASECKWVVPGIKEDGLTGGAVWYDAIAEDTERLILEYLKKAVQYGACVANYTEAVNVESENNGVSAVIARDCASGEEISIACSVVVNGAGPWLNNLSGSGSGLATQKWACAINIVVKKQLFKNYAVGLEGYADFIDKDAIIKRGKRLFFFVPWQEKYTMIGTTYKSYSGSADSFALNRDDIIEVLAEVNRIYPEKNLVMEDVTFFHGGLLPMNEVGVDGSIQIDKSSKVIDHGQEGGIERLISIKGVKYTTAPDIARRVIRLVGRRKMLATKKSGVFVGQGNGTGVDFGSVIRELGDNYGHVRFHLQTTYGSNWREVFTYLVEKWQGGDSDSLWFSHEPLLLVAELYYFIYEEMAVTLADVVFRRSNLGSAECPDGTTLIRLSQIMGAELGWDAEERTSQVEGVLRFFAPLQKRAVQSLPDYDEDRR